MKRVEKRVKRLRKRVDNNDRSIEKEEKREEEESSLKGRERWDIDVALRDGWDD